MRKILIVGCLLLVIGLVGCGVKTETMHYYHSPGWVNDGRIIFVGERETVDKDVLGSQLSSDFAQYVLTIYPSGTGESSALFDTTNEPPYDLSCSPTTDYVAYMAELRNGQYGKIIIQNIAGGTYTGPETIEINFSPRIKSFDWSNDGSQLVYCTTREVHTIDRDGYNDTLITAEANLEFVTWKYGNRIAFVSSTEAGKILSLINPNTKARDDLAVADSVDLPQISRIDTNVIYGISGGSLASLEVSSETLTTVKASFTGRFPRLSPDADMVVYDKVGEDSGVYVLDLASGAETQVK